MELLKEITSSVLLVLLFVFLYLKHKNTTPSVKIKSLTEIKAEKLGRISLTFLVLSLGALLYPPYGPRL